MQQPFIGPVATPRISAAAGRETLMGMSERQKKLVVTGTKEPSRDAHVTIDQQRHDTVLDGRLCHQMTLCVEVTTVQTPEYTRETDPREANAILTRFYLDAFFDFINVPAYEIFPRHHFMGWAMNGSNKSSCDRVMLYALMAWATVHCTNHDASEHRKVFKNIVYSGLDLSKSRCSLQVAHTMLFLAHAEYADRQYQAGSDVFQEAIEALVSLKLDSKQSWQEDVTVYGFSPATHAECCRRTLWAAYCSEIHFRLGGAQSPSLVEHIIPTELPCITRDYDWCQAVQQPRFEPTNEPSTSDVSEDHHVASCMSHMIQISQMCGEVHSNALSIENNSVHDHRTESARRTRDKLESRLKCWAETYNACPWGESDKCIGQRSEHLGKTASLWSRCRTKYAALNVLFHYAHMNLNRRIRHRGLSREQIATHGKHASDHAVEILCLAQRLISQHGSTMKDYAFVSRGSFTIPALCEAIDVVTAVGRVVDILEPRSQIMSLMYSTLDLLEYLSLRWGIEYARYTQIKERVQIVFRSAQTALYGGRSFFRCSSAVIPVVARDCDIVYGTDRQQYLRAAYMTHHDIRDGDVFEIDTSARHDGSSRAGTTC